MTQETKWTPGPWNDGIYHATRSGGRTFAHIRADGIVPIAAVPLDADGYGRAEGEANARLIAAAPEMAEALKWVDENAPQNKPSDTFTEVIFRRGSASYGEDHDVLKNAFDEGVVYGLWLAAEQARAALSKAGA